MPSWLPSLENSKAVCMSYRQFPLSFSRADARWELCIQSPQTSNECGSLVHSWQGIEPLIRVANYVSWVKHLRRNEAENETCTPAPPYHFHLPSFTFPSLLSVAAIKCWPKANLGRTGFILAYTFTSQSIIDRSQERNSEQKPEWKLRQRPWDTAH